jgi:hypothetical protein
MKMIDDARAVWRHYSTQALAFVTTLGGVWAGIPEWAKTALPSWVPTTVAWLVFIVAALGLGGKFIDQSKNDPTQTEGQGEQK